MGRSAFPAVPDYNQEGIENVFLPGFPGSVYSIGPIQRFLWFRWARSGDLLPKGSIPAHVAQDFTNLANAFTNFGSTPEYAKPRYHLWLAATGPFRRDRCADQRPSAQSIPARLRLPAHCKPETCPWPSRQFSTPAAIANGFLNGETLINLPKLTVNIEAPPHHADDGFASAGRPAHAARSRDQRPVGPLPGTQIGGFIPGSLSFRRELESGDYTHCVVVEGHDGAVGLQFRCVTPVKSAAMLRFDGA